jgi:hypothetical protein
MLLTGGEGAGKFNDDSASLRKEVKNSNYIYVMFRMLNA